MNEEIMERISREKYVYRAMALMEPGAKNWEVPSIIANRASLKRAREAVEKNIKENKHKYSEYRIFRHKVYTNGEVSQFGETYEIYLICSSNYEVYKFSHEGSFT